VSIRVQVGGLVIVVGLLAAASAPPSGDPLSGGSAAPEAISVAAVAPAASSLPGGTAGIGVPAALPSVPGLPLENVPWVDPDSLDVPAPLATPTPTPRPRPTPDLTVSPSYAARSAAPLATHGSRSRPAVAITVDDALSPAAIEAILAVFLDRGVNATWFPVGSAVGLQPGLWRRIAGLGFEIGNHTWSHPDLTRLTQAAIESQVERARSAIRLTTGRPAAPFLRPPGGAWNKTVLAAAGRLGLAYVVTWDVTSGDTGRGSADEVVRNATRGGAGTILLFHANDPAEDLRTAAAMAIVIDWYRDRGFELVTLGQLLRVPGPVPFPAEPPSAPASPGPTGPLP
jgi:peptidoglycan/xylan/chitin deacetylase (PgdA/CDA1 family)